MMWPRNLSGVGTVADAGRWSTSSVEIRGSERLALILAVYSTSIFCAACAHAAGACESTPAAANAMGHWRISPVERDILTPVRGEGREEQGSQRAAARCGPPSCRCPD